MGPGWSRGLRTISGQPPILQEGPLAPGGQGFCTWEGDGAICSQLWERGRGVREEGGQEGRGLGEGPEAGADWPPPASLWMWCSWARRLP